MAAACCLIHYRAGRDFSTPCALQRDLGTLLLVRTSLTPPNLPTI
ncbi:MAG: hypothetical protein ABFE16_02790 [Armatimonadia bacterium]